MNAFFSKHMSLALLILALQPILEAGSKDSNSARAESKQKEKVVKYVQGGACGVGNGSKKHPYSSLAQAQADISWNVLVVLPSAIALDGGITLRPGTHLVGEKSPVDSPLSGDQPTITNSSATFNGGNGVIVQSGSAFIKNIQFKDTWASGINYDNATNLTVESVLITGANQGGLTAFLPDGSGTQYYIGGIQATSVQTGATKLCKVVIKDNFAGQGVVESINHGAQRTFNVSGTEFSGLGQNIAPSPGILFQAYGILLCSNEFGTKHSAKIERCYFHDYSINSFNAVQRHGGCMLRPTNGSETEYCILTSRAFNLGSSIPLPEIRSFPVRVVASTNLNLVSPGVRTHYKLTVKDCLFEELPATASTDSGAILLEGYYVNSTVLIKDNTLINLFDNITTYVGGDSVNNTVINGNNGTGQETFFTTLATSGPFQPTLNKAIQNVTITNNNFVGGSAFNAIGILPDLVPGNNWAQVIINAENNCFDGQGIGFAGLMGYDFGTSGAGNATINAHNNSIVGYEADILDRFANVNYLAQRNWWGQGSPCATGADCADTQICEGGVCVGPDNVVTEPTYTGTLDVSNPLRAPIKCPATCRCPARSDIAQNVAKQTKALSPESPEFREKIEKIKERFTSKLSE